MLDIRVRLTGSKKPHAGRVEVEYKGVWGTISSHGWNKSDARVVCRQLGYNDVLQAITDASSQFDQDIVSSPVWFSDVNCNGTEPSLLHCSRTVVAGSYWLHDTDAGVVCKANPSLRM